MWECASQVERRAGGLIVLFGVRPIGVGKAGDEIELAEEAADDIIAIAAITDVIELRQRLGQGRFRLGECMFRVVFTLGLKASFVLQELLPIEVGSGDGDMYGRPWLGQDTHRAD
jgi:hypothetical protein